MAKRQSHTTATSPATSIFTRSRPVVSRNRHSILLHSHSKAHVVLSRRSSSHGMSADFIAGYVSGAASIIVGNPLDLLKTRIQAGPQSAFVADHASQQLTRHVPWTQQFEKWSALVRGAAAPVLGYGALNALLFVAYNRSLAFLSTGTLDQLPERPSAASLWAAGALGGLASFVVSAPTELVKCRAQVSSPPQSSWQVTKDIWHTKGLRGLYLGGGVTSLRDSIGYGFYFWSYELCKRQLTSPDDEQRTQALKVLLCGGIAGVVTWASVFPLDVIKTRVQTYDLTKRRQPYAAVSATIAEQQPLVGSSALVQPPERQHSLKLERPSSLSIAREAYRNEGISVFFRGLGVCSGRAFIVNAVQWAVRISTADQLIYEWTMAYLKAPSHTSQASS